MINERDGLQNEVEELLAADGAGGVVKYNVRDLIADFCDKQERKFQNIKEKLDCEVLQEHGAIEDAYRIADDAAFGLY